MLITLSFVGTNFYTIKCFSLFFNLSIKMKSFYIVKIKISTMINSKYAIICNRKQL